MASPQVENGHIRIATPIFLALCKIRIPGEARQVLDFIIRKTYGFNKTQDRIALSQFVSVTGIRKSHVCDAITKLKIMKLIIVIETDDGNVYKLNKDFEQWEAFPKKGTVKSFPKNGTIVPEKRNASFLKTGTTIDTTTIDTFIHTPRVLKTNKGTPLPSPVMGSDYTPDGFSPLQAKQAKKAMERALGIRKSTQWSQLLFGSAVDFKKAFEKIEGYSYSGNIMVEEVAKTMAEWYESGETRETIREMIAAFFDSDKAEAVTITPNSVFSSHTYNSWKQGKLKKSKIKKKDFWE